MLIIQLPFLCIKPFLEAVFILLPKQGKKVVGEFLPHDDSIILITRAKCMINGGNPYVNNKENETKENKAVGHAIT